MSNAINFTNIIPAGFYANSVVTINAIKEKSVATEIPDEGFSLVEFVKDSRMEIVNLVHQEPVLPNEEPPLLKTPFNYEGVTLSTEILERIEGREKMKIVNLLNEEGETDYYIRLAEIVTKEDVDEIPQMALIAAIATSKMRKETKDKVVTPGVFVGSYLKIAAVTCRAKQDEFKERALKTFIDIAKSYAPSKYLTIFNVPSSCHVSVFRNQQTFDRLLNQELVSYDNKTPLILRTKNKELIDIAIKFGLAPSAPSGLNGAKIDQIDDYLVINEIDDQILAQYKIELKETFLKMGDSKKQFIEQIVESSSDPNPGYYSRLYQAVLKENIAEIKMMALVAKKAMALIRYVNSSMQPNGAFSGSLLQIFAILAHTPNEEFKEKCLSLFLTAGYNRAKEKLTRSINLPKGPFLNRAALNQKIFDALLNETALVWTPDLEAKEIEEIVSKVKQSFPEESLSLGKRSRGGSSSESPTKRRKLS